MAHTKSNDKGFTLVELLIVITILGILAAVTVFAVSGITDTGQANACETEERTINTAIEAYFAQESAHATVLEDVVANNVVTTKGLVPGFLASAPDNAKWTIGFPANARPTVTAVANGPCDL